MAFLPVQFLPHLLICATAFLSKLMEISLALLLGLTERLLEEFQLPADVFAQRDHFFTQPVDGRRRNRSRWRPCWQRFGLDRCIVGAHEHISLLSRKRLNTTTGQWGHWPLPPASARWPA